MITCVVTLSERALLGPAAIAATLGIGGTPDCPGAGTPRSASTHSGASAVGVEVTEELAARCIGPLRAADGREDPLS